MNRELALQIRNDLRVIIESYEAFLFDEVTSGKKRVQAVEALATRDIVRSIGMSEVSKTRVDTVRGATQGEARDPQSEGALGVREDALFAEAGRIASAAQPAVEKDIQKSGDNLFKNIKDCIPCNQSWSWGDFDWGRLKEILTFDVRQRFKWLLDIEQMFNGNPILDNLCEFLHSFKDLCPQDILILISLFIAYLTKTLDSIKFNFDGVLKDILAMLLRPYIGGLEDFLNVYIQFLVDQIDCILNLIQVSAQELRDLQVNVDIGRKRELTPEEVRTGNTSSFKFSQDIITGRGDAFFDDVAEGAKETREFLRHDTKKYVHALTDDIPTYLANIARDALDWVESQVQRAQDAVIDILGGEWLVTSQNLSWVEQMQSIATIINILEVIYSLGKIDDLCSEDNVIRVIDGVNDRNPDRVVIPERDSNTTGLPTIDGRLQALTPLPSGGAAGNSPQLRPLPNSGAEEGSGTARLNIPFSLSSCLKRRGDVSEAMLRQWVEELSNGNN